MYIWSFMLPYLSIWWTALGAWKTWKGRGRVDLPTYKKNQNWPTFLVTSLTRDLITGDDRNIKEGREEPGRKSRAAVSPKSPWTFPTGFSSCWVRKPMMLSSDEEKFKIQTGWTLYVWTCNGFKLVKFTTFLPSGVRVRLFYSPFCSFWGKTEQRMWKTWSAVFLLPRQRWWAWNNYQVGGAESAARIPCEAILQLVYLNIVLTWVNWKL